MAKNPKYPYADWRELHGAQREALEDFTNRVKETAVGALEGIASDHINNNGNAIFGESIRQRKQTEGDIKGWQDTISAYEDALKDPASTRSERETAISVINDLQSRVDAYQNAYGIGGANDRAAESVWSFADRLDDSGKQNIQHAKQGLDPTGKALVDLGVLGIETWSDTIASPAAIYSKLFRLTGRDSQAARRSGADFDSAMSYGGASGLSGAAIETLFDGLNGAYGNGISKTEKWAEDISKKLGLDETAKKHIKAKLDDLGEGWIESLATDITNQAFKSAYNGKNVGQNLSETDEWQAVKNAVLNTVLAAILNENK